MQPNKISRRLALLSAAAAFCAGVEGAQAVDIVPNFGPYACTGGPNFCAFKATATTVLDTTQQGAVDRAVAVIEHQFTNAVTVPILFVGVHDGANGFLAASQSGDSVFTYKAFTGSLAADAAANPHNAPLNTAVKYFGAGNQSDYIAATTANARALGINTDSQNNTTTPEYDAVGNYIGGYGANDGIIYLNVDQPAFIYNRPLPSAAEQIGYDAQSAIEHEVDEMLGIGGQGSQLNSANGDPSYAKDYFGVSGSLIGPLDLYRYSAPGTPSFDPFTDSITGCPGASARPYCADASGQKSPYFSVNGGTTSIDTFNQAFPVIGGDAGDWGLNMSKTCPGDTGHGGTGDVQDAYICNNRSPDVRPGTPSFIALEAVGYNPTPEPGTWAMMLAGFAMIGGVLRQTARQRRAGRFPAGSSAAG